MSKKLLAEFIGTFWLVLGGCGSAVLAAGIPNVGIGYVGVSLAFGLTVLTGAFALGHISGGHFNPAVSIGLWFSGRFNGNNLLGYILAQVLGGIAAATVLYLIVTGNGSTIGNFAANGFGTHSPQGYDRMSAFITEFVMTFMFLIIILGATDEKRGAHTSHAPIAIGLALTLIHLISIPVTNTSVNPARSISQALFVGDWALSQLWLFIVAPIAGALAAAAVYRQLSK